VYQEKTAMKVSTDSCLFGAWARERFLSFLNETDNPDNSSEKKILDIGTGTGLLAFMLAQKTKFQIDAIELEAGAVEDAKKNISQSPWPERIQLIHADVREYEFTYNYDFIICNPPFYEKNLKSEKLAKNQAMHDAGLVFQELMEVVVKLLSSGGIFAVMVPAFRGEEVSVLAAQHGLSCREQFDVTHADGGRTVRSFFLFSAHTSEKRYNSMYIRNADETYSDKFIQLLQPYYLYL